MEEVWLNADSHEPIPKGITKLLTQRLLPEDVTTLGDPSLLEHEDDFDWRRDAAERLSEVVDIPFFYNGYICPYVRVDPSKKNPTPFIPLQNLLFALEDMHQRYFNHLRVLHLEKEDERRAFILKYVLERFHMYLYNQMDAQGLLHANATFPFMELEQFTVLTYEYFLARDQITHMDAREVMLAWPKTHTLVEQTIASFNTLMDRTIPALVKQLFPVTVYEHPVIIPPLDAEGGVMPTGGRRRAKKALTLVQMLDHRNKQFILRPNNPNPDDTFRWTLTFGEVYYTQPQVRETDGMTRAATPLECQMRSLTYMTRVMVEVIRRVYNDRTGEIVEEERRVQCVTAFPIMLRSNLCLLKGANAADIVTTQECFMEDGGAVITNGSERVFIGQESLARQMMLVFARPKSSQESQFSHTAEVRSSSDLDCETGSVTTLGFMQVHGNNAGVFQGKKLLKVVLPCVKAKHIPLKALFCALGLTNEQDIYDLIAYYEGDDCSGRRRYDPELERIVRWTLEDGASFRTQQDALTYLASFPSEGTNGSYQRNEENLLRILQTSWLPHVGSDLRSKALYIGLMARRLLLVALGRIEPDDRDHWGCKRLSLVGTALARHMKDLFRQYARLMCRALRHNVAERHRKFTIEGNGAKKERTRDVRQLINMGTFRQRAPQESSQSANISQTRDTLNSIASKSQARRMDNRMDRKGKHTRPRHVHPTHWGNRCIYATPEGITVGHVNELATMPYVTEGFRDHRVHAFLLEHGLIALGTPDFDRCAEMADKTPVQYYCHAPCKVFLNGKPVGVHLCGEKLAEALRRLRRIATKYLSVYHKVDHSELHINTDAGRVVRPLLVVEPTTGRLRLRYHHILLLRAGIVNFDNLVEMGVIEYLDKREEENTLIAMYPTEVVPDRFAALLEATRANVDGWRQRKFKHCEIHPSVMLGVSASIIPYPDHNQSPRNTYQCAMGKQALGIMGMNFLKRQDKTKHMLWYPQRPLAQTIGGQIAGHYANPACQEIMIAFVCSTRGGGQEDSKVTNRDAVQRGLFRSSCFHTFVEELRNNGDPFREKFCIPKKSTTTGWKKANYGKLDADGLPAPGTRVDDNDIIIGKVAAINFSSHQDVQLHVGETVNYKWRDESIKMPHGESGIVHEAYITDTANGRRAVVVVRMDRVFEIGDKTSSFHGQKGTCGLILPSYDLPFKADGSVPDLIINSHGMVSRMTIGMAKEIHTGKLALLKGLPADATPFSLPDDDMEITGAELHSCGVHRYGYEVFYNPHDGKPMEALVFEGPVAEQRLRHMVVDKMHARYRGKRCQLTLQPVEGRSKGGSLRFGEMERDCVIGSGASFAMREVTTRSDEVQTFFCRLCGMPCINNVKTGKVYCRGCDHSDVRHIAFVAEPNANALLRQELEGFRIAPRLIFDEVSYMSKKAEKHRQDPLTQNEVLSTMKQSRIKESVTQRRQPLRPPHHQRPRLPPPTAVATSYAYSSTSSSSTTTAAPPLGSQPFVTSMSASNMSTPFGGALSSPPPMPPPPPPPPSFVANVPFTPLPPPSLAPSFGFSMASSPPRSFAFVPPHDARTPRPFGSPTL